MTFAEYTEAANRATLVSIQVETVAGVEAVEEIAAVPGIDCIFIGLSDLAVDLGMAGRWTDAVVSEQVDRVISACETHGVALGVPAVDPAMAAEYAARGARFLAAGDSSLFARAVTDFVREVRQSNE
jgi:2-keto-3-deoxy-L-rhamnonate aldolase RhmA